MEYFTITIIALGIIALIAGLVIRTKRKTNLSSKDISDAVNDAPNTSEALETKRVSEHGIIIPIEKLSSLTTIDEQSLCEIKDKMVISRITATIPHAAEIASKTLANKALSSVELYKVIIPSGATLTNSKQIEGAVRGFFRGAKGIKGQANLVKVDPTALSKASTMATSVANVMNVGSLVVGQYYMAEISAKIETMSKNINKISDFQDREFKSRILALIARVGEISNFSSEILENNELRNRKLQTLDDLKGEGTQLLQQVNLDISETINKNQKPDYKEYQESVDKFSILVEYQHILISLLDEISKLTYLFGRGDISNEMSYSIFNTYLKQSNLIRASLEEWHGKHVGLLGIDIDKNRRNKTGIAAIPGIVNDDWKYKELESGLGQKINAQKAKNQFTLNEAEDIYDKDVQIVIKDGKYYYLPESPARERDAIIDEKVEETL